MLKLNFKKRRTLTAIHIIAIVLQIDASTASVIMLKTNVNIPSRINAQMGPATGFGPRTK